jgi:Sec-independent protein translocase protein TatA
VGFGPAELIIVALILLVLFGPTLVAFFLGYTLGKKKAAEAAESPSAAAPAPLGAGVRATSENTETVVPQDPAAQMPPDGPETQEIAVDE